MKLRIIGPTFIRSTGLLTIVALAGNSAFARGSKREGFNFGAGLRLAESQEGTEGTETSFDLKRHSTATMVSPHLGFAFAEHFDIGISLLSESSESTDSTTSSENDSKLEKKTSTELSGTSLYYRFLFADVMFFELAGGYYQSRSQITENIRSAATSSSYVGKENVYKLESQGFGYHVGAGIDIEIGKGFYVRGSYLGRQVSLKNIGSSGNIGKSSSNLSRHEAQFGIVHFLN